MSEVVLTDGLTVWNPYLQLVKFAAGSMSRFDFCAH